MAEARDRASNLEFWSGRNRTGGAGEDRARGRAPFRRPSFGRGRARPMAAAALLAGLAAAWLVAGHDSHLSAATDAPPAVAAPSVVSSSTVSTTTTVPFTRDCRGLSPARRDLRCVVDGIDLEVRLFTSGTVAAAYRSAAGADVAARSGTPACAQGVADERAWSAPASPDAAVGRYRCRFERGRAAMWWTRGDRLVHAVARDGDLAALFSWWRAHPSE
jgi:hypothetical protein